MDIVITGLVAFVVAGFVKGVIGFGFPIIVLIILTLTIGLYDALAVLIVPTLATNLWQAISGPYFGAVWRRMWRYFFCAAAGILFTSRYLTVVDVDWLTGLLGVVLAAFATSQLYKFRLRVRQRLEAPLAVILGTLNGALTGLTGSFMVPSVLFMQALHFPRDMLIQAMGIFFALSTTMLTISLGNNDLLDAGKLKLSAMALVPSFAGLYVGQWLRQRIDEHKFQKIFLLSLLMLGAYLVWRSLADVTLP